MGKVTTDFKVAFGRMLVMLTLQQTADYVVNPFYEYAEVLYQWTYGALRTEGKIGVEQGKFTGEYASEFTEARACMGQMIEAMRIQGREYFKQAQVKELSFRVKNLIFPIAIGEGVLVLNEESFSIVSPFINDSGGKR